MYRSIVRFWNQFKLYLKNPKQNLDEHALALTSAKSALLFGARERSAGFFRARALFPTLFFLTTSAFTNIVRLFSVLIFG